MEILTLKHNLIGTNSEKQMDKIIWQVTHMPLENQQLIILEILLIDLSMHAKLDQLLMVSELAEFYSEI